MFTLSRTCVLLTTTPAITLLVVMFLVGETQLKRWALGEAMAAARPGYLNHKFQDSYYPLYIRWHISPPQRVHMSLENTHHLSFDSSIGDLEWNATLPSGGAVVYLEPDKQVYTVGMFHRLRCLNIIRKNLVEFYADDSPDANVPQPMLVHHCMNYLRQMVLCDSDLTLESIRSDRGNHLTTWDTTHQCKDWIGVYGEAERNWKEYYEKQ